MEYTRLALQSRPVVEILLLAIMRSTPAGAATSVRSFGAGAWKWRRDLRVSGRSRARTSRLRQGLLALLECGRSETGAGDLCEAEKGLSTPAALVFRCCLQIGANLTLCISVT